MYTTAGLNSFMVPAGVTSIQVVVVGGSGGGGGDGSGGAGGHGAKVSATLPVTGGSTLFTEVDLPGGSGDTFGGSGGSSCQ
jgi:hypothetical protein